jgi:hypothetical protein
MTSADPVNPINAVNPASPIPADSIQFVALTPQQPFPDAPAPIIITRTVECGRPRPFTANSTIHVDGPKGVKVRVRLTITGNVGEELAIGRQVKVKRKEARGDRVAARKKRKVE